MGLDAWRLYDTIRLTRRPVECTAVLVVERVLGLVGIFTVILVLLPFARDITQRQSLGELVAGTRWLLAATTLVGVLVLLQPAWFRGLLRLAPGGRARRFAASVIDSATAYSNRRGYLLLALLLAVVGQVTTTLMYFANAMSLATENVRASEVLLASAVMTVGTFIAPSASGEGVRELASGSRRSRSRCRAACSSSCAATRRCEPSRASIWSACGARPRRRGPRYAPRHRRRGADRADQPAGGSLISPGIIIALVFFRGWRARLRGPLAAAGSPSRPPWSPCVTSGRGRAWNRIPCNGERRPCR